MKRRFVWVALAVMIVVGTVFLLRGQAERQPSRDTPSLVASTERVPALTASGVIQAQQVSVASEFGGRVAQILVREGEAVRANDPVAQIDTVLVDGEIAVAQAAVAVAEAGLRQARAGARPGQIAVAEAELAQAQAAHLAAQQAVTDTAALVAMPQDLDLQIALLRAQIEAARAEQAQAVAQKDAIEVAKGAVDDAWAQYGGGGRYEFTVADGSIEELVEEVLPEPLADQLPEDWSSNLPSLGDRTYTYGDYELDLQDGSYTLSVFKDVAFPLEATLLPNQWWQAWVGVNAATAQVDALEAKLSQLVAQRAHPQSLEAQYDEAMALAARMASQVRMAEAQVGALRAGLAAEDLAVIEAQVAQAQAGVHALQEKRDMLLLRSPISGTVVDLLVYEGEVATQGAPVLSIADLSDLTLTVYVPETRLGELALGQEAVVMVDSFLGRRFAGRVSYISERAEFTPRNVATVEERQNLVFAVDIRLSNKDSLLKPGMPADVRFVTEIQGQP